MAALKNRTVTAESLAENVVGKSVIFTDTTNGNEYEGVVISINADGSYRIDTGDEAWDLEDGEFEFVDESVTSDEDEESPQTEEKTAEPEIVEEEEDTIPPEKSFTKESIAKMDLKQLKTFVKEQGLKGIPLRAYQKVDMLRDCIFDILGFSGKEKTVKEKSESPDRAKKIVIKKEKKIETEKIQRRPKGIIFEMYQEYAKLLLESPKTSKELLASVAGRAKKTILTGTLYHFIKVGFALGIIIEFDGKYTIKR